LRRTAEWYAAKLAEAEAEAEAEVEAAAATTLWGGDGRGTIKGSGTFFHKKNILKEKDQATFY
jgi:hypothetical protein